METPRLLPPPFFFTEVGNPEFLPIATLNGTPEATRTPDLRFRKPLLYPAELPGLQVSNIVSLQGKSISGARESGIPVALAPS